ncbi:MAG: glutamine amidotransferase [Cyanobacteria bacterium P01_C01_bin.120]
MSPNRRILVIVHQATSSPGLVGDKLRSRGYQLDVRCPAIGEALPAELTHYAGAVVFGGPMSANDDITLPFIRTELEWIATALAANCPYLGICLGAQLLARVLGANVSPRPDGQREIGYGNLQPAAAGAPYFTTPMAVYQWHSEGFTLPTGATPLAIGETFPNQAFRYGNQTFGLQFHPEMTTQLIDEWTTRGAEQLDLPGAQPRDRHFSAHQQYGDHVDRWLETFLTNWLGVKSWEASKSA